MTKSSINELSQKELEQQVTVLFVNFLAEARKVFAQKFTHQSEIDSEVYLVSIATLEEFNKYRLANGTV